MPTPPPQGVGAGFWERLKSRVMTELGGGRPESPGTVPAEPGPDEQIEPTLMSRLQERLHNIVRPRAPDRRGPPTGGVPGILFRIRQAGRSGVLLFMRYNSTWRHVEPYSFRYRGVGRTLRFFGYCRLHGHIEAYVPEKIEDLVVTDERFAPRWKVELY